MVDPLKQDSLFDNLIKIPLTDEDKTPIVLSFIESLLDKYIKLQIILKHDIFNEVEAATYLRLSDPQGAGRNTIRNYALRSKMLSFYQIGRNGLTFTKSDLDNFLNSRKVKGYREL
ncbi:MAG: helix-turn-helix domain-containing protein [Bacteriovoracaceae bacterium]|nr:helix-turn-helix domain-containing protein [Bacteriovoracaceae bacterium]